MFFSGVSARLILHDGDQSRAITLQQFPFTIGRQDELSLTLSNAQVSRQHATIDRDDSGFLLRDMNSRHGTFLNGQRISTASRLTPGDRIQLGLSGLTLVFSAEDAAPPPTIFTSLASTPATTELEKLSLFLQAAQSLSTTRVLDDVLGTLLDYTLRLTGAERGFVFLGDSDESLLLRKGLSHDGRPLDDSSSISHSILRDAARSGQEYITGDVSGDGQPIGRESVVIHELRSVIAIPLRRRNTLRLLGVLYLDSRLRTSTLNQVGRDILSAIAGEAANLIENARMVEAERAADLLRNELAIAAAIQQSVIARELPSFTFATIAARTVQCTEVGGDFYDVIPVAASAGGGFVAIVADVSGKGMPAAILAAIIQGMMYAQIRAAAPLPDAFATVNSFLCSRVSGQKYVTMLALHFKPNGDVDLVNGGHIPPWLVLADTPAQPIPEGDLPVGLLPNAIYHALSLHIPIGARLVLLSDGITETEDIHGTPFNSAALAPHLADTNPIEAVFNAMHRFSDQAAPSDDRTILVINRTA